MNESTTTIDLDLNRQATLSDLVARLEDHGVEFPGLARWRELHDLVRTDPPAPVLPQNLLEQTVKQMSTWAESYALHYVSTTSQAQRRADPYHYANEQILSQLDPALKARIRENAESIIAALRPAFNEATDALRHARSLGVTATDTIATLFHSADAKRQAWTAAEGHATTLDGIFMTRQMLSTVADVPPTLEFEVGQGRRREVLERGLPSGVDWTVTVVKPEQAHKVILQPENDAAPWERWLRIADNLELVAPKAEDPNDPEVFRRKNGMTVEQALAASKAEGESALGFAATTVPQA